MVECSGDTPLECLKALDFADAKWNIKGRRLLPT